MTQDQIDGITKARILANIERAGREPLFQSNDDYIAYVAMSYAVLHADKGIADLMAELDARLSATGSGEVALPPTESEYVPKVVTRFQARAALAMAGLLEQVEAAIAQADQISRLAWSDAQEFRRDSPTIAVLAAGFGWSDEYVNTLFKQAARITA